MYSCEVGATEVGAFEAKVNVCFLYPIQYRIAAMSFKLLPIKETWIKSLIKDLFFLWPSSIDTKTNNSTPELFVPNTHLKHHPPLKIRIHGKLSLNYLHKI